MIRTLRLPPIPEKVKKIVLRLLLGGLGIVSGAGLGYALASPDYSSLVATAVGVALCVGAVLIDLKLGLLLWIVVSPYARFIPLDIVLGSGIPDLKLDRMITLIILILWAAQVAVRRRKVARVYWTDVFFALFTLFTLISYVGTNLTTRAVLQIFWDAWLVPFLAYFLARQIFNSQQDLKRIGVALGIIGIYLGLLATQEQLTGVILFYPENRSVVYTATVRRVVNLLGNPAFIGVVLATAAPFAARGVVEATTRRRRLVWFAVLIIMGMGSFFCYNRAGWAGLLLGLLVMVPFYPRFRRFFVPLLLTGAVILLALWGVVTASPVFRERLLATGPIQGRLEAYEVAGRMIRDHLFTGVGQGNYSKYYTLYERGVESEYFDPNRRVYASTHNSLLYVLVHSGLFAFLPYVAFLLSLFWITWRFYRSIRAAPGRARGLIIACWGAFVGYLVPSQAADIVAYPYATILFLVIAGGVQGWIFGEGHQLIQAQETP